MACHNPAMHKSVGHSFKSFFGGSIETTVRMITPMVTRLVKEPFDREGWLFELKWDGFRAIAETESNGSLRLYSRRHNDFTKRFPPIAHALAELKAKAIFDGETCALDEHGFPRFEWLVNRGLQKGTLVYYVFDLLKLADVDLRGWPLLKRKNLLEKWLRAPIHGSSMSITWNARA